jgi:hypothetical protein
LREGARILNFLEIFERRPGKITKKSRLAQLADEAVFSNLKAVGRAHENLFSNKRILMSYWFDRTETHLLLVTGVTAPEDIVNRNHVSNRPKDSLLELSRSRRGE